MAIVNDTYMVYDLPKHMYIPQPKLFKDKLNLDINAWLGGEIEELNYMEDLAYFIQDFCIEYAQSQDSNRVKKLIAYDIYEDAIGQRTSLQRAYVELVRYAKNDEGDMIGIQTGYRKGTVIPLNELRGSRELSSRLERVLKGTYLLYTGKRIWTLDDSVEYGVDY